MTVQSKYNLHKRTENRTVILEFYGLNERATAFQFNMFGIHRYVITDMKHLEIMNAAAFKCMYVCMYVSNSVPHIILIMLSRAYML